jgi:hypothetical protein
MKELKVTVAIFFALIVASFAFMRDPVAFTTMVVLSDITLIVGLYIFLSSYRKKKVGKIIVEHVQYPFTFVVRAFCRPKGIWIVYNYGKKKFMSVGWKSLPLKSILAMVIGAFLIFTSYLISMTITQVMSLIVFRLIILFLFFVIGLYSLLIGLYRLFSFTNKNADKVCSYLNKNRYLRSLIEKGMLYVQISPNFLFKEGFVDSVEFVLSDRAEHKKMEKIVIDIARLIDKV